MKNYWIDRSMAIIEEELILVKSTPTTQAWYDRMPKQIPAIYPDRITPTISAFGPQIGIAHHMRLSKWGIEGVLKIPRKFFRMSFYVLYEKNQNPNQPFWVVFHNN